MKLTVYSYAKCSTCRDAIAWLRARKIEFLEKPIYDLPPTESELRAMLALKNGQLRRLFNTSGIQYRERGLATKLPELTLDEAVALLRSDGRLVRRPFVIGDRIGLLGFDVDEWTLAFGRKN